MHAHNHECTQFLHEHAHIYSDIQSFIHGLICSHPHILSHAYLHSLIPKLIHSFKTNSRQGMDQDTEVLTILLVLSFICVKLGCGWQGEVILLGGQGWG